MAKSAADYNREHNTAAKNLPTETKRVFWKAVLEGKNVGEAKKIAGIKDVSVAAALCVQCHQVVHVPMAVEEIE